MGPTRTLLPALAVLVPLLLVPPGTAAAPASSQGVLRLQPAGGGVSELTVPLRGRIGKPLRTNGFSMVGVTWTGAATPATVRVRWRAGTGWSRWRSLPLQTDLPNGGEAAGAGARRGTQPVWTGAARTLELDVRGPRPRSLRLTLLDTRSVPAAAGRDLSPQPPVARGTRPTRAPRPPLLNRAAWGADPSWRNGRPSYNRKVRQVHLHHTATANAYAPGDVPGILQGMYRYHTRTLGWFDLGYNFVVDSFGRAWVGRSGGFWRPVRGAHTLGFNHNSVGIAVLGRFGKRPPTPQAVTTVVRLAAWKLDRYDGRPRGWVRAKSRGSDHYPAGTWVRLPVIDGHRDTSQTACPGAQLYAQLPAIRERAGRRVHRYDPPGE